MKTALQKEGRGTSESRVAERQFITPEVNIVETKDGYILTAEMPGVNKAGLEITLEGQELTIVGRKATEVPAAEVIFCESRQADYRRVFELDPSIDSSKISAQIEQGLLVLQLPKAERVKPRRIEVAE